MRRSELAVLGLLWLVVFLKGALFSGVVHVWSPIDELQHFHYARYVAEHGRPPVLGRTLLPADLLAFTVEIHHADKVGWEPALERRPVAERHVRFEVMNWEAMQPPLFYSLAAPVAALFGDDPRAAVHAVRLLNAFVAAWIVVPAFFLGGLLAPGSQAVRLGAAGLAGLLPGFGKSSAYVSPDPLTAVLGAFGLWAVAAALVGRLGLPRVLGCGVLLGAGLLTKLSNAYLPPLFLGVLAWRAYRERQPAAWLGLRALALLAPVAVLLGPWVAWNYRHYGAWSGIALVRELLPMELIGVPRFSLAWLHRGLSMFWPELWATGKLVPGGWVYASLVRWFLALACVAMVILLLRMRHATRGRELDPVQLALQLTALVTAVGFLAAATLASRIDAFAWRHILSVSAPLGGLLVAGPALLVPPRARRYLVAGLLAGLLAANAAIGTGRFVTTYGYNFLPRLGF